MEPLEQAIVVVEEVVTYVCAELGSEAQEHIDPNQLFVRAECQIKKGLTISEAVKTIASPLLWEVKEKREKKIIDVKRIRDELERSTEYVFVGQNKEELESASEHLHTEEEMRSTLRFGTLDLSSQGSSSQTSVSDSASGAGESKPETGLSDSSGTSCIMNEHLMFPVSPGEDSSASLEDNEISVLSPVPPKPAPLIELSDDSSNSSLSSRNSICIVVPEKQCRNIEEEIDLQDAEKVGIPQKLISALRCKEKTTVDRTHMVKGVTFNENSDDEIDGKVKKKIKPVKQEVTDDELVHNENDGTNNVEQARYQSDFEDHKPSIKTEDIELPGSNTLSLLKENSDTDENRNKKKTINGIASHVTDAMVHQNQSLDMLWEDARYVCSLLPYFQLADVHQSMVDNYYHPNRRAYVLDEYLKLAADRDEIVPDSVSPKKRSYVEDGGAQVMAVEKKIKIEHNTTEEVDEKKLWNQMVSNGILDGSLPSTSGANNLVVRDKTSIDLHGFYVTNVRTNGNHGMELYNSDPRELESDREKWCREKIDFVSAVICNIDKEVLRVHVESCYSDADVEGLIDRLMDEQENSEPAVNQIKEEIVEPVSLLRSDQLTTSAFQPVDRGISAFQPVGHGSFSDVSVPGSSAESQSGTDAEDQAGLAADLEDRIMSQIATLSEMFNDADPDYLQERCVGINGDQAQFQVLVEELLRDKRYPKIEEYNKRQKRLEIKKKFIEGMSVEEFLEYFEDPEKVFCDVEKSMSPTYVENARAQLKRDLPYQFSRDIDNELRKHNYHYLPTLRALKESSELGRRKTKRTSSLKEKDLDDIFIKELCYVRMQTEIKEHLLKREENKRRAFMWARATYQLQECGCCFDDEVLEEDMETCNATGSKHKFCVNCIRRFAEEEIGQGRTSFRCLDGECTAEFSLNTLKKVMKPAVFSNLLERKQLEEIAAAGIEDLVACPFCNFQTIMPDKEDKVFKCLNPECMKDSCRFCKEPNHVPLRCEEVEKQHQRDARTFMENRMTEAMVRECWKCKKRFIKEDGCNKMRCSCGAMMCYICKKQIKGYDHFEDKSVPLDPSKCPLWSNSEKIHAEEVRDVAVKLRQEMDPKLDLLHNPLNDLPQGERAEEGVHVIYQAEGNVIDSDVDEYDSLEEEYDEFVDSSEE
ncbi:uncharacterized protein [Panulirus ornatus]|uniref:uncharacterized protein n=1 Tax=Panulirus ornatus TaxID=150431 RepID=UPI003A8762B1